MGAVGGGRHHEAGATVRIILSKDRAAQLDLLLRSLERNAPPEPTAIIYRTSNGLHALGYRKLFEEHRGTANWLYPDHGNFEQHVKGLVSTDHVDSFVTFLCDDDILYRPLVPNTDPFRWIADGDPLLCASLRLGANTVRQYPSDLPQEIPWPTVGDMGRWMAWPWENGDDVEHDFGYPGSLDGHTFRTADLRKMLDGRKFPNPTALECALVEGCNELADERPLMACYPHSVLVGNPINRVSEQSGVRFGTTFPVTADECNRRFLAGERIDLDALNFDHVNGAHTEVELRWRRANETA